MMWLSDMFTARKQELFLDLMRRQAELLVRTSEALQAFLRAPSPSGAEAFAGMQAASKELVGETIEALRDTFVTPFDRQDIYNLSQGLDDMLAYLASAAGEVESFNVDVTPPMMEMARLLDVAAHDIRSAVENMDTDPQVAADCSAKARDCEKSVEDLYRRTLAQLFDTSDVSRIFKLREIYRHLSNGADRADAIGKLIGKIVVKAA
ncbi:MAG: DUF47 family protein [Candidatus Eremiobacteraeota bacterium]|nr:DUF47 family protein [Candidatus Eremiobacteraeota bacterium]MBV8367303.1 DUF47 family protein [Candidatus Eremiobacteraeota bacterium]